MIASSVSMIDGLYPNLAEVQGLRSAKATAAIAAGTTRIALPAEVVRAVARMPAVQAEAPLATVSIHLELRAAAAEPVALPAPKPSSRARIANTLREANETIRRAG